MSSNQSIFSKFKKTIKSIWTSGASKKDHGGMSYLPPTTPLPEQATLEAQHQFRQMRTCLKVSIPNSNRGRPKVKVLGEEDSPVLEYVPHSPAMKLGRRKI